MSFIVKVSGTPSLSEDTGVMFSTENVTMDGMGEARVEE
jgi:hypothetical protein